MCNCAFCIDFHLPVKYGTACSLVTHKCKIPWVKQNHKYGHLKLKKAPCRGPQYNFLRSRLLSSRPLFSKSSSPISFWASFFFNSNLFPYSCLPSSGAQNNLFIRKGCTEKREDKYELLPSPELGPPLPLSFSSSRNNFLILCPLTSFLISPLWVKFCIPCSVSQHPVRNRSNLFSNSCIPFWIYCVFLWPRLKRRSAMYCWPKTRYLFRHLHSPTALFDTLAAPNRVHQRDVIYCLNKNVRRNWMGISGLLVDSVALVMSR